MNGKCAIMEGDALAVLEAMNEMHQRGYTNVMIETDSQIVAEASTLRVPVCQSLVLLLVR
jgi:ribonuclease HI